MGRELDETWNIFIFLDSSTDTAGNSTRNSLNFILAKYLDGTIFFNILLPGSRIIFIGQMMNNQGQVLPITNRINEYFSISRDIYLQNTSVHMLCFKNARISFI